MRISDWSSDVCSSDLNDPGSDCGRGGCKALRVARGCDGYFDTASGKCPGQGLADLAEADDCVVHHVSPILCDARGQSCASPPSTASSLAVMKLLSDDARKAAAAPISAGSPMRSEEHTSELQSLMRISYAVF